MLSEWTPLWAALVLAVALPLFVVGGLRFRSWVVDDRPGIPRYPQAVETIFLWLVYSGVVSIGIVVVRQTMRHL